FANKILASQANQEYVREATLAKERNNQKGYQAAIDKISCPET
ncbi:TPA: YicS family protein, partial [Raoultella ornithinolytica]